MPKDMEYTLKEVADPADDFKKNLTKDMLPKGRNS